MKTKRTPSEIDFDRKRIAELHLLDGMTQEQIAEVLNEGRPEEKQISRQMISYDLRKMREIWRVDAQRDIQEAIGKELAILETLQREYWEAWQNSKGEKVRTKKSLRTSGRDATGENRGIGTVEETKEEREPNVAYLQGVERVRQRIAALLGLDDADRLQRETLTEISLLMARSFKPHDEALVGAILPEG